MVNFVYNVDATNGDIKIPLSSISNVDSKGRIYEINKVDKTDNKIQIIPNGTDLIDGDNLLVLNTTNESVILESDGNGNWIIL